MLRWALVLSVTLSAVGFAADELKPIESPALSARVSHAFTVGDAHLRVQQLLDYWHTRFGVNAEWDGERVFVTGKVWGVDFRAMFEVLDGVVSASATDPGPLWRGKLTDYTVKKLKKYLSPNYAEP